MAKLDPGLKLPANRATEPLNPWDTDMGKVTKPAFIDVDPTGTVSGRPQMATTSRGSIGAYLAESFCEHAHGSCNECLPSGLGEAQWPWCCGWFSPATFSRHLGPVKSLAAELLLLHIFTAAARAGRMGTAPAF